MRIAKMPDGLPEMYQAIQGEGATIGKPSIFVRLSTCNLHCRWCDTFYTWNFERTSWKHDWAPKVNQVYEQMEMTEEEVADYIRKVAGKVRRVVFTGGEPTLQQKSLVKVMDLLRQGKEKWLFELETHGANTLNWDFSRRLNQINCSPKLASSGNDNHRNNPEAIQSILECYRGHKIGLCFKFVYTGDETDLAEIEQIIAQNQIPDELVYIMPEGTETEAIISGSRQAAEFCLKRGFNLSTRLQVILYGTKRAV